MGVLFVLVNKTNKEYVDYGGKLGEGQTVKGILSLMNMMGWKTTDNIIITGFDYMSDEEIKYTRMFVTPEEE